MGQTGLYKLHYKLRSSDCVLKVGPDGRLVQAGSS